MVARAAPAARGAPAATAAVADREIVVVEILGLMPAVAASVIPEQRPARREPEAMAPSEGPAALAETAARVPAALSMFPPVR